MIWDETQGWIFSDEARRFSTDVWGLRVPRAILHACVGVWSYRVPIPGAQRYVMQRTVQTTWFSIRGEGPCGDMSSEYPCPHGADELDDCYRFIPARYERAERRMARDKFPGDCLMLADVRNQSDELAGFLQNWIGACTHTYAD